jgi:hypothetical protein
MFNQLNRLKSLHRFLIRRERVIHIESTLLAFKLGLERKRATLVMGGRFMCEITYDNLTICIGLLEDLCVRRTTAAKTTTK